MLIISVVRNIVFLPSTIPRTTPVGQPAASMNMVNNGFAASAGPIGVFIHNNIWAWTANDLHQGVGNIILTDGSAQEDDLSDLAVAMGTATNGPVTTPVYNFPDPWP